MKLKLPSKTQVKQEVRKAAAENDAVDRIIESKQTPETREPEVQESGRIANPDRKLSRLIDGDFPFDDSQKDAIEGVSEEQYSCLTGAAGTGKTTVTKAIVDRIMDGNAYSEVNMKEYFANGESDDPDDPDDPDDRDESERPTWVPAVAMCAFTGRASQMIKKNFPRDWHGNIMTIHRLLAYVPEFYEDYDDESGEYRKKMRFVPTYTADCLLPWDHIIIDEAGMLSVDLWENLWAACKPGCRITMIGDINQLPPTHGKSVFGFAMAKWPSWELTTVHRQQGKANPIVDNAWRVINGIRPESGGRFQMVPLKGDAQYSSRQVRAMLPELAKRGVYDPVRDTCITPINGEEGSRGFALGQLPLNREFALIFNPKTQNTRYIIDGGRERKQLAVGDKVMATKNDWQAGITNGMTGIVVDIYENAGYTGDRIYYGPVEEVNARMSDQDADDDFDDSKLSMEDFERGFDAIDKSMQEQKEKRERGPASHTVVVRFGSDEHGFEIPFTTLAEVGSLMTAYVVTCHKMQGGEAPVVVIICHDSHKSMLYREWLYTAITRASEKCILLYTETALRVALNKQKIAGRTLREKVKAFNDIVGYVNVTLPESESTRNRIMNRAIERSFTPARLQSTSVKQGGLAQLIKNSKSKEIANAPNKNENSVTTRHAGTSLESVDDVPRGNDRGGGTDRVHVDSITVHVHKTFNIKVSQPTREEKREVVDGGRLTPQPQIESQPIRENTGVALLAAPPRMIPTWGAYAVMCEHERLKEQRLLPPPPPKPMNKLALKLGIKR